MKQRFLLPGLVCLMALAACQPQPDTAKPAEDAAPEANPQSERVWTKGAMVSAADPRAVDAGLAVLREGGTAVDAAIAVHAVLGLVEPQSSGLGGGGFMVYYDYADDELTVFDGRETAPASADETLFMENGEVLGFVPAWQSGRSVGVPGAVALYKAAHDAEGKADWARLFQPAIDLAAEGFEVSPRLAGFLANPQLQAATRLDDHAASAAYFYPDGAPLPSGSVRVNAPYAALLSAVAEDGPSAFYTGANAEAIVAAVSEDPLPGALSLADISGYEVAVRDALCGDHEALRICSAPPPSSGGITQNMIYGLYKRMVPDDVGEEDVLLAWTDAQRLAYADRDHYVGDPDFVSVPSEALIDPAYLDVRAGEAGPFDRETPPGDPGAVLGTGPMIDMWGSDLTDEQPGTTHISVVDQYGNAVAFTATVESPFGNSRMVNGYLLNNQLTDFSRQPRINGKLVANAPAGGKRPRSSMSPTLVFDKDGELFMVTGSPGGNSIVAYVSKTILGVAEWGLSAQEAVDLPNLIGRGREVGVETSVPRGEEWAGTLDAIGYTVQERSGENSGLNIIVVREDGLEGAADKRREGVTRGFTPDD